MTLAKYEANRPEGEQKLDLGVAILRASVVNGEIKVVLNHKDKDGYETLPYGYILGSSYMVCKVRRIE